MTESDDTRAAAQRLLSAAAVRDRACQMLSAAERDELSHFALDLARLNQAAAYVADVVRDLYPDLDVPFHSRWRHFSTGGHDRWQALRDRLDNPSVPEIARIRFDLAIVSVLLDAGAGEHWRFVEPDSGETLARSEGLAVASLHLFASGALSDDPDTLLRVDGNALARLDEGGLAVAFQVTPDNPLVGLPGRLTLLHRLADVLRSRADLFGGDDGSESRLGNLFDHVASGAEDGTIAACAILNTVLHGLGDMWPGRIELGGLNLGDTWRHSAIRSEDASTGLVPFHKLSQWLTYSLIEPLVEAGIPVTEPDGLTGLAEYRNGGLFVDLEVLRPKHGGVTAEAHAIDSELVVEWRALTVALLDRLAGPLQQELGVDAGAFPLAKLLEGGTWNAGRRIAAQKRHDGTPPIRILSEGTVF